jgi:hypothetical protein
MNVGFAAMEAKVEGLSERVDAQSERVDTLAGEVAARQFSDGEKFDKLSGEFNALGEIVAELSNSEGGKCSKEMELVVKALKNELDGHQNWIERFVASRS